MREKACMSNGKKSVEGEEDGGLRRGPWAFEEDTRLIHYIAHHGEGQWNLLAKLSGQPPFLRSTPPPQVPPLDQKISLLVLQPFSGLKRTGKSCRLRWLNYLKPDVKRGNLTPHEQLLILHLHSVWGNRWSKIAQHLPGRTDNEIKNHWRTRIHKHARQLRLESNSKNFLDTIRRFWTPKLFQEMDQSSSTIFASPSSPALSAIHCPPLLSSSPGFMTNSTFHPGENPYLETSESTDFSSDYSKISLLLQNQDYPSGFLQNDMSLKSSTLNDTWDFNPSSSAALETYDISDMESHLAGSNWGTADTLWNI